MKKYLLKATLVLFLVLGTNSAFSQTQTEVLAFPGAEGFGKYAVGGRKGSVYRVTNLNDNGAGSLREALSQSNRIIIFDVAGVIKINSKLVCPPNTYIAGQTAPGEGITIYGDGFSFSGASNTICRYIRVRSSANYRTMADAFGLANGHDVIFDHVSVSWGSDENFSLNSDGKNGGLYRITIQNCIISQGFISHSGGGLCQPDSSATVYRTLFIDNSTRNFKMKGSTQYVNNIVYNWKNDAYIMGGESAGTFYADAVSNYFISGPGGGKRAFSRGNSKYHLFSNDNMVDANQNGILDGNIIPESDYAGGPTFASKAYYPSLPTIPASQLLESLLPDVGASLPYRDNLDWYLLDELSSVGKKGVYVQEHESELPIGIPTTWNLWEGSTRIDSDNDGIPDEWEATIGSNPNANDAMTIRTDKGGYANIELYINGITADNSQYYLKTPVNFKPASVTSNQIQLEWLDVTDNETGYIIEEKIGNSFVAIDTVGQNINTCTISGLEPESSHIYRVKAYDAGNVTNPTPELTIKVKPVPVSVTDPETYNPDVIWTGAASNIWDLVAANWNPTVFSQKNNVLFDDSSNAGEITIANDITVGTVVVKGSKDYKFSGVLAGDSSVNKTGTGKLTLPDNNTYKGATVMWDGVMEINKLADGGQPSSIGASPNYDFNWVWNGGTIRYTGANVSTNRDVALANATAFEVTNSNATVTLNGIVGGEGDFIKAGQGTVYSKFRQHTYTGNTIIRGGTYELNGKNDTVKINGNLILEGGRFRTTGGADGATGIYSFPVIVNISDSVSYFEPTRNSNILSNFSGMGDITIECYFVRENFKGSWSNYYGTVTLAKSSKAADAQPWFMINNEANSSGIPNSRVFVKKDVRIIGGKSGSTYVFGGLSGESGSFLQNVYVKNSSGSVTWKVGSFGSDEEFNGMIYNQANGSKDHGTTHIVKEGNGYWRLTANNAYRGTTTINGGTLIVNGTHAYNNGSVGAYTVNESGILAGKGTVNATVTVKNGGYVNPGDVSTLALGTISVKGATSFEAGSVLNIEVDRKAGTNDKLAVTGALTIAGDLKIDLLAGELAKGDEMTILSATSYSGQFANIIPATPGEGLYWDFSSLYTSGILKVSDVYTGVNLTQNPELKIRSDKGTIIIEGLQAAKNVSVYNISGIRTFGEEVSSDVCSIPSGSGIYFVKVGNKTMKVMVP